MIRYHKIDTISNAKIITGITLDPSYYRYPDNHVLVEFVSGIQCQQILTTVYPRVLNGNIPAGGATMIDSFEHVD